MQLTLQKYNENILKEKIPTKTSELINDSNYINKLTFDSEINKKVNTTTFNTALSMKQDKLTVGDNIEIKNNVISAKSSFVIGEIISVACGKDYVPEGCLPCDGAEYSKAQFPSLWSNYLTSENYEIEETYNSDITFSESCTRNNGVISNFENGGFTFTIPYKNVGTAEIHFATGSDVTTAQVLSTTFADKHYLLIYNGKLYYTAYSPVILSSDSINITETEVCTIEANTEYYIKLIFDGDNSSCYLYKKENNELIETIFKEKSTSFENQTYGYSNNDKKYYFRGSFDLTKSYYPDENGKLIYLCTLKTLYKTLLNTCTYEDYATDFETYGQCAKFAVDLKNETFKVPLIKDGAVIQQALSDGELGKAYNAGLPNIKGTTGVRAYKDNASLVTGAFQLISTTNSTGSYGDTAYKTEIIFDASLSNSIYGNSDTVQPNAVALRYFIVVANGQINESMMDWSAWASGLQSKLNTDLTNFPKPYVTEMYENGSSGYVLYSNGFCEQWGKTARSAASDTVTLLKPYKNADYNLQISAYHTTLSTDGRPPLIYETSKAADSFVLNLYTAYAGIYWKTSGYIS